MKEWSIPKPPENWRVKLYFDTNILMFLSDKTHVGLNHAIAYLNTKTEFVDLISSEYALFEFLENRKKKHYKKHLYDRRIRDSNNFMDFINNCTSRVGFRIVKSDSNFKWRHYYSYNIAGFSYLQVYQEVLQKVEEEIKSLRAIGVEYEENVFNTELFEPTKQLCLSSRISRHDCMITTSASFPKEGLRIKDIIIWTSDQDFFKAFHECAETQSIFPDNKPRVEWTNDLSYTLKNGKVRTMNLEVNSTAESVNEVIRNKIVQYIINKNVGQYVGITDQASNAQDVVYIVKETQVNYPTDGIYLTVIGKTLDFIITSKLIGSFWLEGAVLTEQDFNELKVGRIISVRWNYTDSHQNSRADIIATLKQAGHFVFLNSGD